jgi:hypothetical protein
MPRLPHAADRLAAASIGACRQVIIIFEDPGSFLQRCATIIFNSVSGRGFSPQNARFSGLIQQAH